MYTDKKNILQLVALLEAHGITKVVLCPGSRNTPIVHTLSNHPNFTCYVFLSAFFLISFFLLFFTFGKSM